MFRFECVILCIGLLLNFETGSDTLNMRIHFYWYFDLDVKSTLSQLYLINPQKYSFHVFWDTKKTQGVIHVLVTAKFCLVLPVVCEWVAHCSRLLCSTFASFKMLHKRGINKLSLEHRWHCGTPVGIGTLQTHTNQFYADGFKKQPYLEKALITQILVILMTRIF